MDCIEALKTRRSVRAYTGEPVSREVIEDIIDCGRLAATAINIQPWEFVAVTEPAMLRAIAGVAEFGRFIAQAAVCVVVLCKDTKYYLEDGPNASQNILVAARTHGLGGCWVAGDKKLYAEMALASPCPVLPIRCDRSGDDAGEILALARPFCSLAKEILILGDEDATEFRCPLQ